MSLKKAQSTGLLSDDSKYYKPSYRQKGSEFRGLLYRGTTANAFTKKTIGSIPSKFETVLYPQGNSSKKGFGSNGFRFTSQVSENPGPGAYIDPVKTSVNSFKQASDSYSRKGYGNGFISTSQRFRIDNYHPYQVPGPGSYKYRQASTSELHTKAVGPAFDLGIVSEKYKDKETSAFANPVGKRRIERNTQALTLGPGSYNIPRSLVNQQEYKSTASFKAKDMRFINSNSGKLPGPGQYETDMEGIKRELIQNTNVNAETIGANFKQPTGSKRVKVNLYDPFENVEGEEKRTPGPGHYVMDQFAISKKTVDKAGVGSSSMFAMHDILDRFGKPKVEVKSALERASPGPGQYFYENPANKNIEELSKGKSGISSVFKSDVRRGVYVGKKQGPGPAFYKVRADAVRESKNINPTKEWI